MTDDMNLPVAMLPSVSASIPSVVELHKNEKTAFTGSLVCIDDLFGLNADDSTDEEETVDWTLVETNLATGPYMDPVKRAHRIWHFAQGSNQTR